MQISLMNQSMTLTVKMKGDCVVVSGILDSGLIDKTRQVNLGAIVLNVGGAPIHTVDNLKYYISQLGNEITFLIKTNSSDRSQYYEYACF